MFTNYSPPLYQLSYREMVDISDVIYEVMFAWEV